MALPQALRDLPEDFVPQELTRAGGEERAVAGVLFEQRRSASLAYCRTATAVYALHRVMYADAEAQYLAGPGNYQEALEARRRLTAANEALEAQVSTLLRVGPTAAAHAIETAVGLIERLPRVFALIGQNVISPKAGEVALHRSRVLSDEQARQFDALIAERLTVDYEVLSVPALRDAADLLVAGIDPEAAERRRKAAELDRRITFRPEEDGMAAAYALLPAHDMHELSARVRHIAGTVCEEDPRTAAQRQADGLVQLTRGYSTLGCKCDGEGCRYRLARFAGEPDADGVVTRFITMINVVVNEKDVAEHEVAVTSDAGQSDTTTFGDAESHIATGGFGYLEGHGLITGQYARELAARSDAKIRPFGQRITDEPATPVPAADPRTPAAPSTMPRRSDSDTERETLDFDWQWDRIVLYFDRHDDPGGGVPPGDGGPRGDGPFDSGLRPLDDDREAPEPPDPPDATHARHSEDRTTAEPARTDDDAPTHALVQARGAAGYRPSADLKRYLRLVFPRCVFPHCNRPAAQAQIDHRREYDHRAPELGGQTTADQIQPLCLVHHQLKTAGDWIDARLPDGRILWTSPDGRRYIVDPHGIVLQLFPDLTRVHWIVPTTSGTGADRTNADQTGGAPSGGRTRLQREHARRERLREANISAVQAEIAQKSQVSQPHSPIEDAITASIGAPSSQRSAPSDPGPPPF